ncbi:phophatidylserine decarboxylase associated domain-containing protein [Solirubrobacter taibaiensis]|nr:phophatidylserine decarboxylase associated domain-containing protein [Solirubrobacter taibaiensis]
MIEEAIHLMTQTRRRLLSATSVDCWRRCASSSGARGVAAPGTGHAVPMSSLFAYMMMTPAAEAAFRLARLNGALRAVLREWCEFLDSKESCSVLNEGPSG